MGLSNSATAQSALLNAVSLGSGTQRPGKSLIRSQRLGGASPSSVVSGPALAITFSLSNGSCTLPRTVTTALIGSRELVSGYC